VDLPAAGATLAWAIAKSSDNNATIVFIVGGDLENAKTLIDCQFHKFSW